MGLLVYTRPGCLLCQQVKDLLDAERLSYTTLVVDDRHEQLRLATRFGAHSFPIVIFNDAYVGGYAHVLRLSADGRLRTLLESAAPPPTASDSVEKASWSSQMDAIRKALRRQ